MKRLLLPLLSLASGAALRADELIKNAQSELKELGFFYGEVTGETNPETTAAIRRYQIRNGQEVTGTLSAETLQALGLGSNGAPLPPPKPAMTPPAPKAPTNLRRDETVQESDRDFLRREAAKTPAYRDPSAVAPPAPLNPPARPGSEEYAQIFANTPFESAPVEVQAGTVRKAQALLARRGHYRDPIDGAPGPATEEALLGFQRRTSLTLTGRLDLETLSAMALLPGRSNGPPMKPFTVPPGSRSSSRVLRGIWID